MYLIIIVFLVGVILSGFIYKKSGSAAAAVAGTFVFFLVAIIGYVIIAGKMSSIRKEKALTVAQEAGFSTSREYDKAKVSGFNTKHQYDAHKKDERRLAEIKRDAELAECRKELSCWAEKKIVSASYACKPRIEQKAKYSFEWTDGFFGSKLTRYRWKNKTRGIVTYIGDKIKFQNGFGAWQNCTYECDYDPENDAVLGVRVSTGGLKQ